MAVDLKSKIRDIPDFPKPGIVFKDLTPLIQDPVAYNQAVDEIVAWAKPKRPEIIVGIESRGFLFAAAVARELKLGMSVIRKKGKLPWRTVSVVAPNEYAVEHFEMHTDGVAQGQRVLIVDDLIATGSSSISSIELVRKVGGYVVGFAAVADLDFLKGIEKIHQACPGVDVLSLVTF
jgi:adenine phosphoribosyltransferase